MSTRPPTQGNKNGAPRPAQRPTATRPSPASGNRSNAPAGSRPGPTRVSGARPPQRSQNNVSPAIIAIGVIGVLVIVIGIILVLTNKSSPSGSAVSGNPSHAVVNTTKGSFTIHLFTDDSTVTGAVKNFQTKVTANYFNGLIFHRVEGFVVQGGDPTGTGSGGGSMPGEYNTRSFVRGAVGMASTAGHATQVNDSQWFVIKTDATSLDGQYVNFGEVSAGMDVVDQIVIGDKMTTITLQP